LGVRFLSGLFVLAVSICVARGQEQEQKLFDRLLRPKMVLQNSAQNKSFVAPGAFRAGAVPINSFHIPANAFSKSYSGEREFSTRKFLASRFRDGNISAPSHPRTSLMIGEYPARATVNLRDAFENGRVTTVRDFDGTRPFLGVGKSQKFLNAQNPPLTIEQVRELLNKNK
jgi:hypothetical protein